MELMVSAEEDELFVAEAEALVADNDEFVVIETLLGDEDSEENVSVLHEIVDALEEPDEIVPMLELGVIVAVALAGMLLEDNI